MPAVKTDAARDGADMFVIKFAITNQIRLNTSSAPGYVKFHPSLL
jgi:hypothetical protein